MATGEGVLVAQGGGSWVPEHHQSTRSTITGSGEAMRGSGGGSTESLSSPELGMAGACCPRVQGEPYPFYRRRQREESKLGKAKWGRATRMAWARGQGTVTAVAGRGRSWRPSRGSGTRASRPCSQRGRPGGKPWALEGGLGWGRGAWPARWRRRRTASPWARCREARGRRNGQWQFRK